MRRFPEFSAVGASQDNQGSYLSLVRLDLDQDVACRHFIAFFLFPLTDVARFHGGAHSRETDKVVRGEF